MKKYKTPLFESVYFNLDSELMKGGGGDPGIDDETEENPWDDKFESETEAFNGLTFKA